MLPDDVASGCVRFAIADLAVLAGLRTEVNIRVFCSDARVWVMWEGDDAGVVQRVLPLPGAQVYERRDGLWFRRGCRLPSFDVPSAPEESIPLSRALVPAPVMPVEANAQDVRPVQLTLVRDERPRAATALRCSLDVVAAWSERATTAQLGALSAAYAGEEVLITGRRLPSVADGRRYWGSGVLTPLGFRPEPALGETALRSALGVAAADLLILEDGGFEAVPYDALRPLSRAGVRLARERRGRTA